MFLTLAICTWNRAQLLEKTLQSLAQVRIPAGLEWEVLVVNNNCTDATDEVLRDHQAKLPLRRLHEPNQGHAHSRNCATFAARGQWTLWTDDDVLLPADHFENYRQATLRHPDAVMFGGPVRPWFEQTPPAWLTAAWERVRNAYAVVDYGPQEMPFEWTKIPFGANYMIRTDVQQQNPYDAKLGRVGTGMVGGEETRVMQQIISAGGQGWWIPSVPVDHFIPASRMTRDYIRRAFIGYGQTENLIEPLEAGERKKFRRQLIRHTAKLFLANMLRQRDKAMKHFLARCYLLGKLEPPAAAPRASQQAAAPSTKAA